MSMSDQGPCSDDWATLLLCWDMALPGESPRHCPPALGVTISKTHSQLPSSLNDDTRDWAGRNRDAHFQMRKQRLRWTVTWSSARWKNHRVLPQESGIYTSYFPEASSDSPGICDPHLKEEET